MVTAFSKRYSWNHSLICTVTILISLCPFFNALLAFNMKTISFTQGLHLAVSSARKEHLPLARIQRHCHYSGHGSSGGWIHLQEPSLTRLWAPDSWSSFLLAANPHILSCCLKSGLTQVGGEAFGHCVCSSDSCWVFRDLAAQSIPRGAVWVPAKLKSSEGQSWNCSVTAFLMGVIFVPLLGVFFCGAFTETYTWGVWKKVAKACCFSKKMLAQHLSGVSLGVLAEAPERRHYGTTVPQYLRPKLGCCT